MKQWLSLNDNCIDGKSALHHLQYECKSVPALVYFEVYRKIKLKADETKALEAIGFLSRYPFIELSREISLFAADISIETKLGMADSIVLAHARYLRVSLLTLDKDFAKIPDVRVLRP